MKKKHRKLNLLPFYFRNIGLILIGLLLVSILVKLSGWADLGFQEEYKTLAEIVLLTALLIIAISKGRIEDERTLEIRTKVYAATFISGVVFFIVGKMLNFLEFFHSEKEITAFGLLLQMFIFYFIFSWIAKRRG